MQIKSFKVSNLINAEIGTEEDFSISEKVTHIEEDDPQIIAPVTVDLTFLKMKDRINADLNDLSTKVLLQCGRCLIDIKEPISIPFFTASYLLNPAENSDEEQADNFTVDQKNNLIDISEAVRDEVLLASPAFPLCKEGCKGLCPLCGANRNQKECGHEEPGKELDTPSPFAVLKDLVKATEPKKRTAKRGKK